MALRRGFNKSVQTNSPNPYCTTDGGLKVGCVGLNLILEKDNIFAIRHGFIFIKTITNIYMY